MQLSTTPLELLQWHDYAEEMIDKSKDLGLSRRSTARAAGLEWDDDDLE